VDTARTCDELIVRAEDRIGLLARIVCTLYEMGISILSAYVTTINGQAEIHLLVDAPDHAREGLTNAGFQLDSREVVVVELTNRRGFLCKLNEVLARKGISIHDLAVTAAESCDHALVVFTTSADGRAVQLLRGR
jgi:hypothetical protein